MAEILTLVQISKTRRIPILPVQRYRDDLIHWFRATPVREGAIDASAGARRGVDNPREVVDAIFKYYEHRAFGLSAKAQEMPLHL